MKGANVCNGCDFGEYGSAKGNCTKCKQGMYQDEKYSTRCKTCKNGLLPNPGQTACSRPAWKIVTDCDATTQYLDNSDPDDPMLHSCETCPDGGECTGYGALKDIRAKAGYWRVPWSEHKTSNISKCRCFNLFFHKPTTEPCFLFLSATMNRHTFFTVSVRGRLFGC